MFCSHAVIERFIVIIKQCYLVFYITYEIKSWSFYLNNGFDLRSSLFRAVKLDKNVDRCKYSYSGYSI